MSVEELEKWAEGEGLESAHLDDLVHGYKSQEASGINNGGLYEQLSYLLAQNGGNAEAVKREIKGGG